MHHETIEIENTDECIEKLKVILRNGQNTNPVCQCRNLHFPVGNITFFFKYLAWLLFLEFGY